MLNPNAKYQEVTSPTPAIPADFLEALRRELSRTTNGATVGLHTPGTGIPNQITIRWPERAIELIEVEYVRVLRIKVLCRLQWSDGDRLTYSVTEVETQ